MGMTVQELVVLDWDKIDLSAGAIQIGGGSARILPLEEPLRGLLAARQEQRQTRRNCSSRLGWEISGAEEFLGQSSSEPMMPASTVRRKSRRRRSVRRI